VVLGHFKGVNRTKYLIKNPQLTDNQRYQ